MAANNMEMKMYSREGATLYNVDCMELMKTLPDRHFDLAIVDPPYGIGKDWKKRNKGAVFADTTYDNSTPPPVSILMS